jgi:hypothetical protein
MSWLKQKITKNQSDNYIHPHLSLYSKRLQIYPFLVKQGYIQNLWIFFCNYCFSKRICSWKIVTTNVQAKPHRVARFGKQLIINVKEVDLSCAFINTGDGSQSSNHRKIQHVPMWRIGGGRLYIIRKSLPWNTVVVVLGVFLAPSTLKLSLVDLEKRQQILIWFNI